MNISELRHNAESGSVVAQGVLGICYLEGIDVEIDYDEAFRLLSAAAAAGAPRAIANLARMYAHGWGTEMNPSEAVRLYEIAVARGESFEHADVDRLYCADSDRS